ncbi:MAG: RIO1 family regulatory kinase/ATPase [Candidatus Thorarchaeota archaeon]
MELLNFRKEIIIDLREDFPELVDKFNHFILKFLPSKKNLVAELIFNKETERLPKELVIKAFKSPNAENEFNTLKKLQQQNMSVPKILFFKNPYLILEKLDGVNLCDFINNKLKNVESLDDLDSEVKSKIIKSIEKLAVWLTEFHHNNLAYKPGSSESIVLNKGDTRLRDFIYDDSKDLIYATDFEDSYKGNHLDDVAWICCSLLDTNPGIFELNDPKVKIDLLNRFLKEYYQRNPKFKFDFKYFTEHLIENLNIVMRRRHINLNLEKSYFIKQISREI